MNDTFFDKRIKEALERLEAPYDPESWILLESRLNAPFAEEQPPAVHAVDKAIFRSLDRLEAPYQPAHWELLAQRMAEAVRLRRRLWLAKLSEAAIFLLLLANLDSFPGADSTSYPRNAPAPSHPQRLQAEAAPADPYYHVTGAVSEARSSETQASGVAAAQHVSFGFEPENRQSAVETALTDLTSENPVAALPFDLTRVLPANEKSAAVSVVAQVPGLLISPFTYSPATLHVPNRVVVNLPRRSRFYAATFASFDRNHTSSEGYGHAAGSYGGGVSVGYRRDKWGVEAGLVYSRKRYRPKKEIEIYGGNTVNGYYGSFASEVDADMVSIPIKLTHRIAQFGQMTAQAVAGVSTHVALDKNYQYQSVYYPGQAPPSANPDPNQQPQLRQKGVGLLENGSLRGNVYASADAGVRLEYPVNRRFVAFVEPLYRHAIGGKGVGPQPARINTLSVQAGVMATL